MDKAEADQLFSQALQLQQAGQIDQAQPLYEQVIAAFPNYPHVPHLLGVIVSQHGNWFLARRLIESSLIMTPSDPDALANLAWVLFHLAQYDNALARADQAVALNPGHARAVLTRGLALRFLGRHEEAIASFDHALRLRPDMTEALNYRGQSQHSLERYTEALQSYEAALAQNPRYADVYNNRGASLTLLDRHPEALESFQNALALQPRFPEALFNLGLGLQHADRLDEALAHYDAALELKPDYPEALMHRAFVLQRMRKLPQDCLASLDRALALRPGYFEALNGRANILAQLEQYAESLVNYDTALKMNPAFHEAHLNRGHALREMGRLEEAAEAYREAMRRGGDAQSGLFALAAMGQEAPPPIAPPDYIVSLFDGYADRFDDHLVNRLKYQAHERLCEALMDFKPPPQRDIFDLGCGTGLCGPLLAPIAASMTGVDLSPKMLEAAGKRGMYTRLVKDDVTAFLEKEPAQSVDMVVSTDVFIYIGQLEGVFAGVRKCMRPGGLFGFSIEASEGQDFVLRPTRRYAQSPAYIERLAAAHGFEVLRMEPSVIRKEHGVDTAGYIAVLRAG
ncbi:MAG: tetratricopeptide repeat protein [Burkholderiales bacterium]|nr:tetratricopeptide repeat protein [Burkholderiales bacterium]